MKPVLYLELIGVNRWNEKDRWIDVPALRYLSGASLIVSYADREGMKDTGYGFMLTFARGESQDEDGYFDTIAPMHHHAQHP